MLTAYINAHNAGIADSVEVWREESLQVAYMALCKMVFFVASRCFIIKTNCSKLAMWALVNWLKRHNAHFIDCQLENPYLMSLGATAIRRPAFLAKLHAAQNYKVDLAMWIPQELNAIYECRYSCTRWFKPRVCL